MADFCNYTNEQQINIEPYVFIDTLTGGTAYIGTSSSFTYEGEPIWKIKKQWLDGTVCKLGFPDGCQCFKFAWSCRCGYTYY